MTEHVWDVDTRDAESCWEWRGRTNNAGYGYFYDPTLKGIVLAHRRAWELANGAIPRGMSILHSCDNPPCCNPSHLRVGSARDNAQDVKDHGRALGWYRSKNAGESHPGSKLTQDDVDGIRAMRAAGHTYVAIGAAYGISFQQAQKICTGGSWVQYGPRSAWAGGS